jgi:hypothetical protein
MLGFILRVMICLTFLAVTACGQKNLYVAHHTVVGVNAAMNMERTAGHLVIGYDRNFIAIAPRSVPLANGGKDAMAALSCSELVVKGIFVNKFVEYLATGKAGAALAKDIGASGEDFGFFRCFDDNVR